MITKRAILDAIYQDENLTAPQRETMRVLVDKREPDGTVEPRATELMEHFRIKQTAVYNRIDRLIRNGYLREIGGTGRQRVYEITLPNPPVDMETVGTRIEQLEEQLKTLSSAVSTLTDKLGLFGLALTETHGDRLREIESRK